MLLFPPRSLSEGRLAERAFVPAERVRIRWQTAAPGMLVRPFRRFQFLLDVELLVGLEQQYFHAARGEYVGGHSARGSGAHCHGIVSSFEVNVLFGGCRHE